MLFCHIFVHLLLKQLALNEGTFLTKLIIQKLELKHVAVDSESMPLTSGLTGQAYKSPFDLLVVGALPTMAVKLKQKVLS